MPHVIAAGICGDATGLWQMFSKRETRCPWVTFGCIILLCVSLPVCPVLILSPSSALNAAHAAPIVCSTVSVCVFCHLFPCLSLLKHIEMQQSSCRGKQCVCQLVAVQE